MRALALALALVWPLAGAAQDRAQDRAQTLADIRAELTALGSEIAALRAEMVSSGTLSAFGGVSALDRMDAVEAALTSLNGRTEALQLRIDRIVADGTNRIADLEFRLTELEGGDIAALGQPAPLGAQTPAGPAPGQPSPAQTAPAQAGAAAGAQADLDRAREVLGQGDFRAALAILEAFAATRPADPLTGEAQFLRGEALSGLGETGDAARAYLASFSGDPGGPRAADALYRLGLALGTLGQRAEACVTLGEVGTRFPGSMAAGNAAAAASALGCG
ncbi:MAG: tol-pal system protein YbgF [Gemmobacter sp.]